MCEIRRVHFCITFTELFSRDAVKILAEGAPSSLNYDVILKELYQVSTYGHYPAMIMRFSNLYFDIKKVLFFPLSGLAVFFTPIIPILPNSSLFCIYFSLLLPIFSFSFTHFFSFSFLFLFSFFLFLLHFPSYPLPRFIFFPQTTSADIPPGRIFLL